MECEEEVAVVFVLLFDGGDFGGETEGEVIDEGFKAVEDSDDFFLEFDWWDGDK